LKDRKTRTLRYLLVAVWPACEGAIAVATVKVARRASHASVSQTAGARDVGLKQFRGLGGAVPGLASAVLKLSSIPIGPVGVSSQREQVARREPARPPLPDWVPDLGRLSVISGVGGALAYEVMALIGPAVVNHGPAIDETIARWTADHQVKWWAGVMERLTKIGNTWTTWGAAGTAAASLTVTWPKHKWLPPATLAAAAVVDHYVTLALRHKFGRPGPPSSPAGTYPCGGVDRVVFFYGLIAYLLWREFSGSPQGKAWAIGAVAALTFNEAYSREYLSKHWFTDILSGVLYGAVLLAPFIAAVRLIAGPAVTRGQAGTR
jgi:membrane-associated phospholipid phosphatase